MIESEEGSMQFLFNRAVQPIYLLFFKTWIDSAKPINQFFAVELESSLISRLVKHNFLFLPKGLSFLRASYNDRWFGWMHQELNSPGIAECVQCVFVNSDPVFLHVDCHADFRQDILFILLIHVILPSLRWSLSAGVVPGCGSAVPF